MDNPRRSTKLRNAVPRAKPEDMKLLDCVTLTSDLPQFGLKIGDVGTIVEIYKDGEAFEVEFITDDARLIALLTMGRADVRLATHGELKRPRRKDLVATEIFGSTVG